MTNHTFSICAYKKSPYLHECIESLLSQENNSKIIVCTSTPNEFIHNTTAKYNLELKINPKKDGISSDWNFALNQAKTQYVTLAHQDDVYFPDYSQTVIDSLQSKPDSLIAYTNYQEIIHVNTCSFVRTHSLNFTVKKLLNILGTLKFGSPIGCPTVTYNLSNLNHFQFSSDFSINMDWYAWYQISRMPGSFVWINQTLMSHRIHSGSETTKGIHQNRRQIEDRIMFSKFWPQPVAAALTRLYSISLWNNQ